MKLSDVMGSAGLEVYAEVALVIFVAVFAAVLWRTFGKGRGAQLQAAERLPLDDGRQVSQGGRES